MSWVAFVQQWRCGCRVFRLGGGWSLGGLGRLVGVWGGRAEWTCWVFWCLGRISKLIRVLGDRCASLCCWKTGSFGCCLSRLVLDYL